MTAPLPLRRRFLVSKAPTRTARALGTSHAPSQDVFPTGRGTAYSKAVTRLQERFAQGRQLGRWRTDAILSTV